MEKSKKRLQYAILILGITALIIGFLTFDSLIVKAIEKTRNSYLDYIFLSITFASNVFIIFFFLTTIFLLNENKRRWIVPLWAAAFFSVVVSLILKIIVNRQRPFEQGLVSVLTILFSEVSIGLSSWNHSFPSFQAVLVFSAIPILDLEFKRFKYVWFSFAFLVAYSRVYFGMHFMSDVLIGGIIGYIIGYSMVIIENKYKLGKNIFERQNQKGSKKRLNK